MRTLALLLGLPHEPPMAAVIRALEAMGAPHVVIDQRQLVSGNVQTWWTEAGSGGVIEVDGNWVDLDDVSGVYTRLTTWADLPEIVANPDLLSHAYDIHVALESWLETTSARVINRTSANDTNNSKPYQAMIIRDHFDIPSTLVTNDPQEAATFRKEFGQIIYKSISGERSIVTSFNDQDAQRLHLLASAPVQFQELVSGVDVRVHVVNSQVFATCVESGVIDYRYDRTGRSKMEPVVLSDTVAAECVALTHRLGLELSGIDLRYADDGRIVCFEVNPSPAYIVYEDVTGQPISYAIAHSLTEARP
jgi:glutathione synthase/RimK-type ligase-like ATP-grasp enzyme